LCVGVSCDGVEYFQIEWRVLYMSFEGLECDINKLKRNELAELSNMEVKICLFVK